MMDSKKHFYKIIKPMLIVIALVLLIGGSYAFWEYSFSSNNNVMTGSPVELEFLESSDVINIAEGVPISDGEGITQTETFDFQVKTKTKNKMDIGYTLYIEKLEVPEGYTGFNDKDIKIYLTDFNDNEVVAPTLISDLKNYKLYKKTHEHNTSNENIIDKYKLRIWIDENVTGEEWDADAKLIYRFKLGVKGNSLEPNSCNQVSLVSADTSGANAPVLSENMIPVYYDTCSNTLRKADEDNEILGYSWYNYDNKMWANSVTVAEEGYESKLSTSDKYVSLVNSTSITGFEKQTGEEGIYSVALGLVSEQGGTISFDYSMTGPNVDNDSLTLILMNFATNETIDYVNGVSGTFSYEIPEGALYILQVLNLKSSDTVSSLSNFSIQGVNLIDATDLLKPQYEQALNASLLPFDSSTDGTNSFNISTIPYASDTYQINQYTGEFEINTSLEEDYLMSAILYNDLSGLIDKYVCVDFTKTSCTTMYKVKEADSVITRVDEYTLDEKTGIREFYKNAKPGTEININDVLTMQTWIPRYKYTVWNYNSSGTVSSNPQTINVTFEEEKNTTGEIECTDNIQGTSDGTQNGSVPTSSETCKIKATDAVCTDSTCNGKTYTHPAFTFGDKELDGFWAGKYEVSSNINCYPTGAGTMDNPNVGMGCNLATIKPLVRPFVTPWTGAMVGTFENNMMAMNDDDNMYGFASTDDTHMMKNIEWGAVAYLSHSKYGVSKEIESSYRQITGDGGSTTGNIYGIYDMNGGSEEYVMGNIVLYDGTTMMSGDPSGGDLSFNHSGYQGIGYDSYSYYSSIIGTYSYPANKYYDKYSFGTSSSQLGRSKLGDAVKEVYNSSNKGWYSDQLMIIDRSNPWFLRGGNYNSGSTSGIFSSNVFVGSGHPDYSARLVISQE